MQALMKTIKFEQVVPTVIKLIASFLNHPATACRELLFTILIWLYDNREELSELRTAQVFPFAVSFLLLRFASLVFQAQNKNITDEQRKFLVDLKRALLAGLEDEAESIRTKLFAFWDYEKRLPVRFVSLYLSLLRDAR
jgi:hypothetical protein